MKVLIAGSNGYLGKQVFKAFKKAGHQVYAFYIESSSLIRRDFDIPVNKIEMHQSFDVIINCARPHQSSYKPLEIAKIEQELIGALELFEKCNAIKIHRFGVWLFGKASQKELNRFVFNPFPIVQPDVKTIERVLKNNWNVVYLPSLVYGGLNCQLKRIIQEIPNKSLPVLNPCEGYNQYVHVDDAANFYLKLAYSDSYDFQQCFIAEGQGYTPIDFAKMMQKYSWIAGFTKLNQDEFKALRGTHALELEKFNCRLPISADFKETELIEEYLSKFICEQQSLPNFTILSSKH